MPAAGDSKVMLLPPPPPAAAAGSHQALPVLANYFVAVTDDHVLSHYIYHLPGFSGDLHLTKSLQGVLSLPVVLGIKSRALW